MVIQKPVKTYNRNETSHIDKLIKDIYKVRADKTWDFLSKVSKPLFWQIWR